MSERRYRDEEVREIFERASRETDSGDRSLSPADGLTLEELKRIGSEVGLPPDRIERAAAELERPGTTAPPARFLGAPVSVSRTVPLPRPPTDEEWEILVADMRRLFHARGKIDSIGNSRHWVNGNLHAYLEPDTEGYRLRMDTLKGNSLALGWVSLGLLLIGLVLSVIALIGGGDAVSALTIAGLGGAGLLANVVRLGPWARERERQFEYISERTRALVRETDTTPDGDDPDTRSSAD